MKTKDERAEAIRNEWIERHRALGHDVRLNTTWIGAYCMTPHCHAAIHVEEAVS